MSQGEFNKYTVRCDTIQHRGQGSWYRNVEQTTRRKKMIGDWIWPRLNSCLCRMSHTVSWSSTSIQTTCVHTWNKELGIYFSF